MKKSGNLNGGNSARCLFLTPLDVGAKLAQVTRLISLVGAVTLMASGHAYATNYKFKKLESLGGTYSLAFDINIHGQVVGWSTLPGNEVYRAALWDGNLVTNLGVLAGENISAAISINDYGHVAGYSGLQDNSFSGPRRATLWTGNSMIDLGALGVERSLGAAWSINNAGQTVGYSQNSGGAVVNTLWDGSTIVSIPIGICCWNDASGINSSGQIVGSTSAGASNRAWFWNGAATIDLGVTLGADSTSRANRINDAGQVIGVHDLGLRQQAIVWTNNLPIELGGPNVYSSEALGINNRSEIVGYYTKETDPAGGRAMLWDGASGIDLNGFLDAETVSAGWILTHARSINDKGWIVGHARNTLTGEVSAFLMSPVPEPSTFVYALFGFTVLWASYRRRSYRQSRNSFCIFNGR